MTVRTLPALRTWRSNWPLLWALVLRELAARHKGSALGQLWPLLLQLSQLFIYTYVFAVVLKVKLDLAGMPTDSKLTFGLWLFCGLLPWTCFSTSIAQAAASVVGQPNLVKRIVFPLVLLPLVPVLANFLESLFGLAPLLLLTALTKGQIPLTWLLLPLVWLPQLAFTTLLGFGLSGLTVFLRDIPQVLTVILNLWLYLTPVVYPSSSIPAGLRDWVLALNPLALIVESYRDVLLLGQCPPLLPLAGLTLISGSLALISGRFYRRLSRSFADVL